VDLYDDVYGYLYDDVYGYLNVDAMDCLGYNAELYEEWK